MEEKSCYYSLIPCEYETVKLIEDNNIVYKFKIIRSSVMERLLGSVEENEIQKELEKVIRNTIKHDKNSPQGVGTESFTIDESYSSYKIKRRPWILESMIQFHNGSTEYLPNKNQYFVKMINKNGDDCSLFSEKRAPLSNSDKISLENRNCYSTLNPHIPSVSESESAEASKDKVANISYHHSNGNSGSTEINRPGRSVSSTATKNGEKICLSKDCGVPEIKDDDAIAHGSHFVSTKCLANAVYTVVRKTPDDLPPSQPNKKRKLDVNVTKMLKNTDDESEKVDVCGDNTWTTLDTCSTTNAEAPNLDHRPQEEPLPTEDSPRVRTLNGLQANEIRQNFITEEKRLEHLTGMSVEPSVDNSGKNDCSSSTSIWSKIMLMLGFD